MFTNETKIGNLFGPEIIKHIKGSDYIEIATGYFAYEELNRLTPNLLKVASRGSCKLLFGMVFHERATPNQKRCLEELHKKLKKMNSESGIFVTKRKYHGKIYKFKKNQDETFFVGSSNFSNSGFKGNIEFNLQIADIDEKQSVTDFLDFLFVGKGIKNNISSSIDDVELKLKSDHDKTGNELKDYEIKKESMPTYDDNGFFSIKHRPSNQPKSSLNLYFDKGRKNPKNGKYYPRPWYEVEVTSRKKEQSHKDYPRGNWTAYTSDPDRNKFYKLNMVTASGNKKSPKAISTTGEKRHKGGRKILGELIKGRMEQQGILKRYEQITNATLEEYGRDCIELKKIDEKTYIMKI